MTLDYNFNSSHSSEELTLYLEKRKKGLAQPLHAEKLLQTETTGVAAGKGQAYPDNWERIIWPKSFFKIRLEKCHL